MHYFNFESHDIRSDLLDKDKVLDFFLDFEIFLQYNIYRRSYFYEWGFRPQRHSFYVPGYVEFIADISADTQSSSNLESMTILFF